MRTYLRITLRYEGHEKLNLISGVIVCLLMGFVSPVNAQNISLFLDLTWEQAADLAQRR